MKKEIPIQISRKKFITTTTKTLMGSALSVSSFLSLLGKGNNRVEEIPEGFWPVMITPYKKDLSIDYHALKALIKWYQKAGGAGLFANCGSSEMYQLEDSERIRLTRFVVDHSHIPVVSTGTFFEVPEKNIDYIKKIYRTGVNGVVLIPSVLVKEEASDEQLLNAIEGIISKTDDIPLGLYECPSPYHRLVSPELLSRLAPTNRFVYFKGTTDEEAVVDRKIEESQNTVLGIYNAVSSDALHSIRRGGAGMSVIAGNFYPELFTYLWKYGRAREITDDIKKVHKFILKKESVIGHKYKLSSKYFMQLRGLNINVNSRTETPSLNSEEKEGLQNLWNELQVLARELDINLA